MSDCMLQSEKTGKQTGVAIQEQKCFPHHIKQCLPDYRRKGQEEGEEEEEGPLSSLHLSPLSSQGFTFHLFRF